MKNHVCAKFKKKIKQNILFDMNMLADNFWCT